MNRKIAKHVIIIFLRSISAENRAERYLPLNKYLHSLFVRLTRKIIILNIIRIYKISSFFFQLCNVIILRIFFFNHTRKT